MAAHDTSGASGLRRESHDGLASGNVQAGQFSNTFRCRHLQAISLRNLVISDAPVDTDQALDGLPTELSQILSDEEVLSSGDEISNHGRATSPENPNQNRAQDAEATFEPISNQKVRVNGHATGSTSKPPPRKRPSAKRQISRSMSTAFAEARQRIYEDRILSRRITTFVSLHRVNEALEVEEPPVYLSEIQATAMNPDFRPVADGEIKDDVFLRSRRLLVRVWAKTAEDQAYRLLLEEAIALPELKFVSRELDYVGGQFRDNTVLYHLPDGVYASYSNSTFERRSGRTRPQISESKSASFDALMRLRNLVEVIDDATDTQKKVASQIETLLKDSKGRQATAENSSAQDGLHTVREAVSRVTRDITRLKHEKENKKRRLGIRTDAFDHSRVKISESTAGTKTLKEQAKAVLLQRSHLDKHIRSHSSRIAEDLLTIFPIEPIPEQPLSFTICGCHCPHAKTYERTHPPANEQEVAAALGFVATIVDSLSRTLLLHVPYTVHALGSNSTVRDDITASLELEQNRLLPPGGGDGRGARTFPLYAKGADPARFRYAVYLLNRDIEELVTKQGLRIVDVRDTLANIGFLLNAVAGSTRELPRREAGRVAAFRAGDALPAT